MEKELCLQGVPKPIQQIQSISKENRGENRDHTHDQDPGPRKVPGWAEMSSLEGRPRSG